MNFLKSSWKTWLAALVGFLLGAMLFHAPLAKARDLASLLTIQGVRIVDPRVSTVFKVDGSQVVGFSCVQRNEQPDCFVASVR